MNKSDFIKLSGWAFIIGAFCFYMFFPLYLVDTNSPTSSSRLDQMVPGWGITYDLSFYGSPFVLAIGMFGLWARYGEIVGKLGKIILLISPVGILISQYGLTLASIYDQAPLVSTAGPLVLFTCLTIFGILAFQKKALPRWNALPFFAGVWFPALAVLSGLAGSWENPSSAFGTIVIVILTVQFIALLILGYTLQANAAQEMATA